MFSTKILTSNLIHYPIFFQFQFMLKKCNLHILAIHLLQTYVRAYFLCRSHFWFFRDEVYLYIELRMRLPAFHCNAQGLRITAFHRIA